MSLTRTLTRFPYLIGTVGGIGVALLGAAVITIVSLSLPLHDENASLEAEISPMQALSLQPQTLSDVRQQLDAFIAPLPPPDELNNALNLLHKFATQHGLSLQNSEYHPIPNRTGKIQQLRITIKTEGEYADLRRFLEEIRIALPTLAITQLSFSRQKIADTRLETTVEFTLFYSLHKQRDS